MTKLNKLWSILGVVLLVAMLIAATSCGKGGGSTTGVESTKPVYGGILNVPYGSNDILGFDEGSNAPWFTITVRLTGDEMLDGDWTQGPAGDNTWTWTLDGIYNWSSKVGSVCDTWKFVEPNHMTLHVRPGVHFSLDPNNEASKLVNGREVTADDVVYSYLRLCTYEKSYIFQAHPYFTKNIKLTAVDKSNIDFVVPNDADSIYQLAQIGVDWNTIVAKEVFDKWGATAMEDWKHAHGCGPFILTDFVSGSSANFKKNDNYWLKDPIGPGKGNKLPYLDGVKISIIPDASTRLSALRSAKIDWLSGMDSQGVDDAKSLKQTTPQLVTKSFKGAMAGNQIFMRTDKEDLPYHIKEVRQALTLATDYKTILDSLYDGEGVYPTFPSPPLIDLKDNVLRLEDCSQTIKDLFVYNPDKAKQMLKDAGYPNGFKCTIVAQNTETNTDYLAIIKEMWSKIGVELTIQPVEFGVYINRWVSRDYDELMFGGMASPGTFRAMVSSQGSGGGYNLSHIVDDRLANASTQMLDAFNKGNDAECARIHREVCAIIYEECYAVSSPSQTSTAFWWPWVKNYHAEGAVGILNGLNFTKYLWIDGNLKKSMGY
jgi:peptide/nickel transport system substrate-binding protein